MKKRPILFLSAALFFLLLLIHLPRIQAQQAIWAESFDTYPVGQKLHGVGGWKGWGNDPFFAALTTDVQAWDGSNSVDIAKTADTVHEFGVDSGLIHFRFYQYIPGSMTGSSIFALLNQYDDKFITTNWSVSVQHDSASGLLVDAGSPATMPYVTDQWVPVCIEIDLDGDSQTYYYNNTLFYSGSWSGHVSGGGITSLAAVDLLAKGASSIYYDGFTLATGGCGILSGDTFDLYLPTVRS